MAMAKLEDWVWAAIVVVYPSTSDAQRLILAVPKAIGRDSVDNYPATFTLLTGDFTIMNKIKLMFSNTIYMLKVVWEFNRSLFWGRLLTATLNGIIAPLNAYMLKILVEKITSFRWNEALITVSLIAIINLINGVLHACINKKLGILSDLFRNYLMFDFNSKIVNMDYEILFEPDMIQKKDMALKAIQEGRATKYLDIVFSCISYIISLVSIAYLLSSYSWWVYFVVIALCAIKIYTVIVDKKRSYDTSIEMAPINTEISYYMNMLTDESYVNDMRMFTISEWVISKYQKCIIRTHRLMEKLLSVIFRNSIIRSFLSSLETVFVYVFVAAQMIFNDMSFADFALVTSTLRTFSDSITNITRNLIDMGENSAYVQIYRQFMATKNKIAVPNKGISATNLPDCANLFEIKNLSFRYPGTKTNILEKVTFNIEKGKFYVVVGKNGVGKTTLVRLLCRLYDPSDGSIVYKGSDLRDLEYCSYRKNIGVVFQDYKYYCLTIAENVAMNDYDETEELLDRVLDALNAAGLGEKIKSLPNGIYTQLGKVFDKEGVILSGGELQKLALARVLFQDPDVVILDEPSSALDALAENELIKTFNSTLEGKTVFYISHRLSVAKYADRVIFMDDKNIKGFDSHEKLLKSNDEYRMMYESQAKHYH